MMTHLLSIDFSVAAASVLYRKSVVSCANEFKAISHFLFYEVEYIWFKSRALVYLDLSFVQGNIYGLICILLHADIQLEYHLLKMLSFFFFHCLFLTSLPKPAIYMFMDLHLCL